MKGARAGTVRTAYREDTYGTFGIELYRCTTLYKYKYSTVPYLHFYLRGDVGWLRDL